MISILREFMVTGSEGDIDRRFVTGTGRSLGGRSIGAVQLYLSWCCAAFMLGLFALPLHSQSRDRSEERLRDQLIRYLRSTKSPDKEVLRTFYVRPKNIPTRFPTLRDPERVRELGKKLFFDPRLSHSGLLSCATCHNPALSWTDGLPQSIEGNSRRSMALFNLAWDGRFNWRGDAGSMMSQALLAFGAPRGMNVNAGEMVRKVERIPGYKREFESAFHARGRMITPDMLATAIEVFVSSLLSPEAPFDRWVAGDTKAISEDAQSGFILFHGKANCAACHNLWRFSDSRAYDIGLVPDNAPGGVIYKAVGLRNIGLRPPYMHTGSLPTLDAVIAFYNAGGFYTRASKSQEIRPLGLSAAEQAQLIAFLRTLEAPIKDYPIPTLPQ